MIYGYCRVSTTGQLKDGYSLDEQERQILEKYPTAIIYKEAFTGTKLDRPKFNEIISILKKGDTFVCCKLDRFARNTSEGIKVIRDLFEREVAIHIFNIGFLENNTMGRFLITLLLAVAELERDQIVERTQMGRIAAKAAAEAKGEKWGDGRPKKYTEEQLTEAVRMLNEYSYSTVAEMTGISKSTLIRAKNTYPDLYTITPSEKKAILIEHGLYERKIGNGEARVYTEEKKKEAIKMLDEYTYKEVSEITGIPINCLYSYHKQYGYLLTKTRKERMETLKDRYCCSKEKRRYGKEKIEEVNILLKYNSVEEVVKMTGVHKEKVEKELKKMYPELYEEYKKDKAAKKKEYIKEQRKQRKNNKIMGEDENDI